MKGSRIAAGLVALVVIVALFVVLRTRADGIDGADVPRPADRARSGDPARAGVSTEASITSDDLAARSTNGLPIVPPRDAETLPAAAEFVTVRGRVTATDGAPLEGARVGVTEGAPATQPEPPAVTDADGRYELALQPGRSTVEVSAAADGRESAHAAVSLLATGMRPASVDFALAELVALQGRLVWDDDDTPIAGASVALERWVAPEARWPDFVPLAKLVTDDAGAFDASLAGGRVLSALVAPPGEKRGRRLTVELPASGRHVFTLRLPRSATLTVAVVGPVDTLAAANGRGTPAPTVVLEAVDGASDARRSAPLEAGEARLEGLDPRREWNVLLRAGRFSAPLASAVRLAPGAQARLECAFDPLARGANAAAVGSSAGAALMFNFRILDASGRELDIAELSQRTTVLWNGNVPAIARSLATGETDEVFMSAFESGSREGISSVPPPVALEVQLGGRTVVRSPVGNGDTVDLVLPDLPNAATLRVVVRDAQGAERLPARIELRRLADDERRLVKLDPRTGEIAAAVPAGAYEVRLLGAQGGAAPQRVELAAGELRTLEFTDAPCGAVRGRLQPPPAADVMASVQAHAGVGVKTMSPLTAVVDADGRFELTTLPSGRWELTCVIAAGRGSAQPGPATVVVKSVEIESGRCAEVVVPMSLPGTGLVSLRNVDEEGLPRVVWVESTHAGVHLSVPVSAARPASLRLPPGTYRTLSVHPATYDQVIARGAFEVSTDPSAPELVVDI